MPRKKGTTAGTSTPRKRKSRTTATVDDLLGTSTAAATASAAPPAGPKRKRGDPTAVFPIKLRVEHATGAHLAALAPLLGKSIRRVTRNDLKAHLTAMVITELARMAAMPAPAASTITPGPNADLFS